MKNLQQLFLNLLGIVVFASLTQAQSPESIPVFKIAPVASKITFYVKSSVKLEGTFDKWDATLVFTSTDASTGVLDIKIQADSVNTGSKSKDNKLKGEHCFDVEKNPYITFSFNQDHTDESQYFRCCRDVYSSRHLETRGFNLHY